MSEHRSSNNIFPFLLGILCGAVLGILLAPESGELTRKKLKRKTAELKGKIEPSLSNLREKVAPVVEEISQRAKPLVSGIKKLEAMGEEVKEGLGETFEEDESLPIDTTLSDHKIVLPKRPASPSPGGGETPGKPKRKSYFKNLK